MRGVFGVISQCVVTDSEEKLVSSKFVLVRDAIALGEISLFQHTLSNAVVTVALLASHPLRLVIFDWLQSSFRVTFRDIAGSKSFHRHPLRCVSASFRSVVEYDRFAPRMENILSRCGW